MTSRVFFVGHIWWFGVCSSENKDGNFVSPLRFTIKKCTVWDTSEASPLLKTSVLCHALNGDERWSFQRAGFPWTRTTLLEMGVSHVSIPSNEANRHPACSVGEAGIKSSSIFSSVSCHPPPSAFHSGASTLSGNSVWNSLPLQSIPTVSHHCKASLPHPHQHASLKVPLPTTDASPVLLLKLFMQHFITSYPKHTHVFVFYWLLLCGLDERPIHFLFS